MTENNNKSKEREFSFSNEEFSFISNLAYKKTGIVLADKKKDMVYSRLVRRLRMLKLDSFAEYCQLLQTDAGDAEVENLVNAITTNLTKFFREGHHFKHLEKEVIAPVLEGKSSRRLRIWSAGCSSGMEPYSLSMTINNAVLKRNGQCDAKILATDIDTNMLETGMQGIYPSEQYENIPVEYRKEVKLLKSEDKILMSDDLKSLISFKHLNLLESWPMSGPFDAIFCRNVVIYFDKPTQQKLFNRMADLMKPEGFLYIGHSENLFKVCDRFELMGRTIYRRLR